MYALRTRCHLVYEQRLKIWTKRGSSSLTGMFSITLDSFSDSQNFLHAFKSLLVLCGVFSDFCACKNFSISTSDLCS